jgi:hypothetical protein
MEQRGPGNVAFFREAAYRGEAKTEHAQKACRNQLVTFGRSNSLKAVATAPRNSSGYTSTQPSDSAWEADVLPLNYTRKSGSYVSLRSG